MTPEAQRIAIAEACGWTDLRWIGAAGEKELYGKPAVRPGGICVPDYLNDLNAMHEAEKVLTPEQRRKYVGIIFNLPASECESNTFATAGQRAKAFLRTLGLWHETR
jgi:hypothetical protein